MVSMETREPYHVFNGCANGSDSPQKNGFKREMMWMEKRNEGIGVPTEDDVHIFSHLFINLDWRLFNRCKGR